MLNRTNRTLSATNNGLNLGTRSFVVLANVNNIDARTLRIRSAHPHDGVGVQVRAGRQGYFGSSSIFEEKAKPKSPGSSLPSPVMPTACGRMSRPALVAEAPPVWTDLMNWPVVPTVRSCDRRLSASWPSVTESRLADVARSRVVSGG